MNINATAEAAGADAAALAEDALASITGVPNYVNAAVPFFFLAIAVELLVAVCRGHTSLYRWTEVIASLNMGIAQQLSGIWYRSLTIGPYIYLFRHYRWTTLAENTLEMHVLTLLLVDLGYYWFHRYAHEFHVIWAGHSVHHSGEDYNLATALRQGALQPVFSWLVYLPLALLGIPPALFMAHSQWNTLGQFWFHTSEVGRLGILEYILNTPAHHRMHHRPPGNCNYGGILIIYDKLFGTFVPEDEQADHYGLAKQLNSFDPIEANTSHLKRMRNIHCTTLPAEEGVSSLWRTASRLFSRRVKHAFVFHPWALLEERPSTAYLTRASSKSDAATPTSLRRSMHRRKWSGALAGPGDAPDGVFAKTVFLAYLTLQFLAALGASYLLMLCVGEVELSFALKDQTLFEILSIEGVTAYVRIHKKQLFLTFWFVVCMHALRNVGRMSDRGVRGVNSLGGEPGRLAILVAFVHLLAARGTISLQACVAVGAAISLPWLLVFHLTCRDIPRPPKAKML